MSFLSDFYAKVLGTKSKKLEETCSADGGNGFIEAYDNEDGFVLYTPEQNKRYKQSDYSPECGNVRVFENAQQSCRYSPKGSTASTTSTSLTVSKKNTTFITVSDIPMELSKQLQAILHVNQRTGDVLRKALPNIDQYNYDFSLERAVIRSFEGVL
ncbi:uncharacterized protein LOC111326243 [Stylophora pistillata]|uniref:UMA domain-containing protein n=1 Tax=Stylophora pistillata TaxID=50429 RepID=A0A2B4SIX2_STYPI|nr:uncharacterized protein LOC111326243 [Stylophora pistillata]PFX28422.1 hypothetical protein AWC38_SpisGene6841 [Stylophora pistillata]